MIFIYENLRRSNMDLQSKNNAREALNNLKMEISSELGYYYNMRTDKI